METTKITVNDIERFITKAVENNESVKIYKERFYSFDVKKHCESIIFKVYPFIITINEDSATIDCGIKYNSLDIELTPKEYYTLAALAEDTIPYCKHKAVDYFNHYFDLKPLLDKTDKSKSTIEEYD